MKYSFDSLERHWRTIKGEVRQEFSAWISIFEKLVPVVGEVLVATEGKKNLFANCIHLLLSKSINHSLSFYALLQQGLLIDASLSARNALETILLLELLITDPSEQYINDWAAGKEFKPSDVRKKLGKSLNVTVRDVIITCDDDFYDSTRMAYSFWSAITHSNLKSAEYSVERRSDGSISVPTGGGISGGNALVNCLFAVVCSGLLRTALITSAVLDVTLLQRLGDQFSSLQRSINEILRSNKS